MKNVRGELMETLARIDSEINLERRLGGTSMPTLLLARAQALTGLATLGPEPVDRARICNGGAGKYRNSNCTIPGFHDRHWMPGRELS